MSDIAAPGIDMFSKVYYPEGLFKERVLPKPLSVSGAVLSGIAKTLLFPILSAISTIGFLIKGCYEAIRGDGKTAGAAFEASLISLAGFLASGAFFVLAAYTMPIIVSSHIVLLAMTITVAIHVYRACENKVPEHGDEPLTL